MKILQRLYFRFLAANNRRRQHWALRHKEKALIEVIESEVAAHRRFESALKALQTKLDADLIRVECNRQDSIRHYDQELRMLAIDAAHYEAELDRLALPPEVKPLPFKPLVQGGGNGQTA